MYKDKQTSLEFELSPHISLSTLILVILSAHKHHKTTHLDHLKFHTMTTTNNTSWPPQTTNPNQIKLDSQTNTKYTPWLQQTTHPDISNNTRWPHKLYFLANSSYTPWSSKVRFLITSNYTPCALQITISDYPKLH